MLLLSTKIIVHNAITEHGEGGGARHRLTTWDLIEFNISWVIYESQTVIY